MKDGDKTIITEYLELAKKYKDMADSALAELNACKLEIAQMKADITNRFNDGQYLWDSNRIVISAPEIVIGNVNRNGDLLGGGIVTVVGSALNLYGAGEAGNISMKAPAIDQYAVNPGFDGVDDIVEKTSHITSVARRIQVVSQNPQEVEGRGAAFVDFKTGDGVQISSEEGIGLMATKSKSIKKNQFDAAKKRNEDIKKILDKNIADSLQLLTRYEGSITELAKTDEDLSKENDMTKTNILALDELNSKMGVRVSAFCRTMKAYLMQTALLAASNRKIACYKKELEELDKIDDENFKKKALNTHIDIDSEKINIRSIDEDGRVRTNTDAGILIRGNAINVESCDEKYALTPEEAIGHISLRSRNISLSTDDLVDAKYEKTELTSAKMPVVGNVTINSKIIDINAVDTEMKDGTFKETKLTDKSSVNIRAEKVKVKTIDAQGKSVGKFSVNSQKISLKSTDIKDYKPDIELDNQLNVKHPEKMNSEKVAENSSLLLLAETMNIGFKKDKFEAKNLYVSSTDNLLVNSKTTLQLTQGEKGSADVSINMSGKNMEVAASGNTVLEGDGGVAIYGDTTMNGKVTAGDMELDNLKASKSVTAPNITDGMSVPGAPKKNTMNKGAKFPESNE
jgi:hypothetical protein